LFENKSNNDSALTITSTTKNTQASLLSTGEQVVMQTALIEAVSPDESRRELVRILLDTGSHRTYITEELTKQLGLKMEGIDITVFTFGSSKPKEITSKIVSLVLKSKDGNTFHIKANVETSRDYQYR